MGTTGNMLQKNGMVMVYLAQNLLGKEQGDRMDTIVTLCERLHVARGTVQSAIRALEREGAIVLEVQGSKGTKIKQISYERLLGLSGISNLVGVMPLPYSRRYEGLATGIYLVFNSLPAVNISLAFMGGSDRRLKSLLDGRYDFAVMSYATAAHYLRQGEAIDLLISLGKHTYVNEHCLITRKDFSGYYPGMKIGVDYSAFNQLRMTSQYFKNRAIELVPLQYSQIIENIKNLTIDGSIWSMEESTITDNTLAIEPLSAKDSNDDNTRAAILIRKNDDGTRNFLNRFFDKKKVEVIQKYVLDNKILPNY